MFSNVPGLSRFKSQNYTGTRVYLESLSWRPAFQPKKPVWLQWACSFLYSKFHANASLVQKPGVHISLACPSNVMGR